MRIGIFGLVFLSGIALGEPLTISNGSVTATQVWPGVSKKDIAQARKAGSACVATSMVIVTTSPGIPEKTCADGSVWDQKPNGKWVLWSKGAAQP